MGPSRFLQSAQQCSFLLLLSAHVGLGAMPVPSGTPSPTLPGPMSPQCHPQPASPGAALRAVGAHPGAAWGGVGGGQEHIRVAVLGRSDLFLYFCAISVPSVQNERYGHGVGGTVMCAGMRSCAHCSSARICLDVVSSFRCRVVYLSAFRSPSVLVEGWSLRTLMHPFISILEVLAKAPTGWTWS